MRKGSLEQVMVGLETAYQEYCEEISSISQTTDVSDEQVEEAIGAIKATLEE